MRFQALIVLWLFGILPLGSLAEEVTVGVVTPFHETLLQLKPLFEQETGHHLNIITDASGALFQRVEEGDEIDVFLSGDVSRPKKLVKLGIGLSDSFTVYAQGRLVLWAKSMNGTRLNEKSLLKLKSLALATPQNSAYGHATQEVLISLNLWKYLQPKIQITKTAADAYHAILSHQTEAGFVGLSQYLSSVDNLGTTYWIVPQYLYSPLYHGAVILKRTKHPAGAWALLKFLRHPKSLKIIRDFGFSVPGQDEADD